MEQQKAVPSPPTSSTHAESSSSPRLEEVEPSGKSNEIRRYHHGSGPCRTHRLSQPRITRVQEDLSQPILHQHVIQLRPRDCTNQGIDRATPTIGISHAE